VEDQGVMVGGPGQTLTIRHDSTSEESFMPGLVLAIQRVGALTHLVEGLERVLDL
jgi:4-hydroxy-tetrahydrodipicolinate reductase